MAQVHRYSLRVSLIRNFMPRAAANISTIFSANLCIYTYRRLQTAGDSAAESFEQRRKVSLELLGLLMDISASQLDLKTSNAVLPSPFPIIILFQVLDAMISLEKVGSDTFLLRERQTFMDMLLHFSTRWRLASKLQESLFGIIKGLTNLYRTTL